MLLLIIGPKGVRKEHESEYVRTIIYLSGNPKGGVGVKNENVEYDQEERLCFLII